MQLEAGLALRLSARNFDELLSRGYRRSGLMLYRPACPGSCQQCVPIRVPVDTFAASRSQRRVQRRAAERLRVVVKPPAYDPRHLRLHNRHAPLVSRENKHCTSSQYRMVFVETCVTTHLIEYWLDDELVGLSTTDQGHVSLSSVYFCWEPRHARLSLGTFSALWEIAWAKERGLRYYYLGYWIANCPAMAYKARFRPHERYRWNTERWG